MPDAEPTIEEVQMEAAMRGAADESTKRQSADLTRETASGLGHESGNEGRPASLGERFAARLEAIKAERDGIERDQGAENENGRGDAAAFRSFGGRDA
jgi:hypothetical protein